MSGDSSFSGMTTGDLDLAPFKIAYVAPEGLKHRRGMMRLVRNDRMIANVQFFSRGGGERQLHSHDNLDGLWFVLKGRVRFYGEGDQELGEAGPLEGFFLPRGTPYWFEQIGEEPLHILQVEAISPDLPSVTRMPGGAHHVQFETFARDGRLQKEIDVVVSGDIVS